MNIGSVPNKAIPGLAWPRSCRCNVDVPQSPKRRFRKSYSRASMKRSNLPNQKTATPTNELIADTQPIEPDQKLSSQPAPSREIPAVTALSATTTNARTVSSQ